jgi:hypothetical protein
MKREILTEDFIMNTARSLHNAGMKGPKIAEIMNIPVRRVHRLIAKSFQVELAARISDCHPVESPVLPSRAGEE